MNQTDELLFKKLRELLDEKKAEPKYKIEALQLKHIGKLNTKIVIVAEKLIERAYNPDVTIKSEYSPILGQKITIEKTEALAENKEASEALEQIVYADFDTDHSKPFEDEGAPDDDFID